MEPDLLNKTWLPTERRQNSDLMALVDKAHNLKSIFIFIILLSIILILNFMTNILYIHQYGHCFSHCFARSTEPQSWINQILPPLENNIFHMIKKHRPLITRRLFDARRTGPFNRKFRPHKPAFRRSFHAPKSHPIWGNMTVNVAASASPYRRAASKFAVTPNRSRRFNLNTRRIISLRWNLSFRLSLRERRSIRNAAQWPNSM